MIKNLTRPAWLGFALCAAGAACSDEAPTTPEAAAVRCPGDMQAGDICVDPNRGSSENPGTPAAPVRTLSQAITLVGRNGPGWTIFLMAGVYDSFSGEQFPISIPAGITVKGSATYDFMAYSSDDANTKPLPRCRGIGTLLSLAPSANATQLALVALGPSPNPLISAANGREAAFNDIVMLGDTTLSLTSPIRLTNSFLGINVQSTSTISLDHSKLTADLHITRADATGSNSALLEAAHSIIELNATASITLKNTTSVLIDSTIKGAGPDAQAHLILDRSMLSISGGTVENVLINGRSTSVTANNTMMRKVSVQDMYDVRLTNSTCDNCEMQGLRVEANTSTLINSRISLGKAGWPSRLIFRATTIQGGTIRATNPIQLDLGTTSSPGMNVFQGAPSDSAYLELGSFLATDEKNTAVGNTWLPNESGADAQGRMPSGERATPMQGKNINMQRGAIWF